MHKLVILDRDGVINEDSDAYVKSAEEWIPIPGSIEAIARLSQAGFRIAVATNQSGLARGYFDTEALAAMHDKMRQLVEAAGGRIDAIVFCPHGPDDGCDCRKPRPGLIRAIERELGISAQGAPLIGDSLRDLQAGQQAGCRPMLVRTGKGEKTLQRGEGLDQIPVFRDLAEAVDNLLSTVDNLQKSE